MFVTFASFLAGNSNLTSLIAFQLVLDHSPKPHMSSFEYSSLLGIDVAFLLRHKVFMRYLFGGRESELRLELLQLTTLELEDMASLPACCLMLLMFYLK